ncbi:MAG: hypothetical protein KatS3mg057_0944 [Herpetosiphonaceae bacterium]|nr:MAG: hypothetical protein KatS3mg057_0944 [Herpetosiphonaceae bacterium]
MLPLETALDLQIKQKLLPKLRGENTPRFRRALLGLLGLLTDRSVERLRPGDLMVMDVTAAPFPESAAKILAMLQQLDREGYTDFYGAN